MKHEYRPAVVRVKEKYTYVGLVPLELCELRKSHWGTDTYVPRLFNTYNEALVYALNNGCVGIFNRHESKS